MTPSNYIDYFEAIAQNVKAIEHPLPNTNRSRFEVITNPPKNLYTEKWTEEFTQAVKGTFEVKDKIGMVLEMFFEKVDEKAPTDVRGSLMGAFILLKKPLSKKMEHIQPVWDECSFTAKQILGYIFHDFRNKIHAGTAYTTPCIEIKEGTGLPVSDVSDLYGWRYEFEFMAYETEAYTYDDQYWNTTLPAFP